MSLRLKFYFTQLYKNALKLRKTDFNIIKDAVKRLLKNFYVKKITFTLK